MPRILRSLGCAYYETNSERVVNADPGSYQIIQQNRKGTNEDVSPLEIAFQMYEKYHREILLTNDSEKRNTNLPLSELARTLIPDFIEDCWLETAKKAGITSSKTRERYSNKAGRNIL